MCTQVCMKIGPKNVSEDQRLARKFACSEVLEKIGAGKNVLKTNHLHANWLFGMTQTKHQSIQWKTAALRPLNWTVNQEFHV